MVLNRSQEQSKLTRIAVLNPDRCKPKRCQLECKRVCPIVKQGKLCIRVEKTSRLAQISEELCIGCGLCVKRCPFSAIVIHNLPSNLTQHTMHRYGQNSFKLHRLPLPRRGKVLGLIGANGTGKSTALGILKGRFIPNLGNFDREREWPEVIRYFRGSEHQAYFEDMLSQKFKAVLKPQYVDQIPATARGKLGNILESVSPGARSSDIVKRLSLGIIWNNQVDRLSGGELQRFALAVVALQDARIYLIDEPSSYLDVRQRVEAAKTIRNLITDDNYVVVVEHDLSVVDNLSDQICVLYGRPGIYGVVTVPFSTLEGINIFLDGFIATENMRFREESLQFRITDDVEASSRRMMTHQYPHMVKKLGTFSLHVEKGSFTDSEIIVLLGENGCGKTTLIRMLAGLMASDDGAKAPELQVSYKPQKISPRFQGSVEDLLQTKIMKAFLDPQFKTDVLKPLNIEDLYDLKVQQLSGGELQRVGLTLALGKPANVYLMDEPSAYLDSDQRIIAARVIKRFILHAKRTAFIVEHDFIMATYLADRVITFDGEASVNCTARSPIGLIDGMNKFLKSIDVTFRRDPTNFRPRINKYDSVKDREQKLANQYFSMSEEVGQRLNKEETNEKDE